MTRLHGPRSSRSSLPARRSRWPAASALLMLAAVLLGGPAEGRLSIEHLESGRFPQVEAIVSVSDPEGAPVVGLREGDLAVTEEGAPVAMLSVQPLGEPLAVALVVDTSRSMRGAAQRAAQQGAAEFLSYLGDGDAVLLLQTVPEAVSSPVVAEGLAGASAALRQLSARGATAYYDTILLAIEALSRRPEKRKAIVTLSDGWDTASAATQEQCIAAARAAGVPIYCVDLSDAGRETLQALADASGGEAALGVSPEGLAVLYRELASRLARPYLVRYQAPGRDRGHPWRLLEISLRGQAGAHDGRQYLVPGVEGADVAGGFPAPLLTGVGALVAMNAGLVALLVRRRRRARR